MTRNRIGRAVLIFITLIFLVGCNYECNHPPRQLLENIQSVEIIDINSRRGINYEDVCNAKVLGTIDPECWTMVTNEIKELPCSKHVMDPSLSFSGSVVRIRYKDGSMEFISQGGIAVWDGYNWNCESHVVDEEVYTNFCDRIIGG